MSLLTPWIRKNFAVDAVQVTMANIRDVAAELGGTVGYNGNGHICIKDMPVAKSREPHPSKAYVNDWVLKDGWGLKIYKTKSFDATFDPDMPAARKREAVMTFICLAIDRAALNDIDATTVEELTDKIISLF